MGIPSLSLISSGLKYLQALQVAWVALQEAWAALQEAWVVLQAVWVAPQGVWVEATRLLQAIIHHR